MVSSLHLYSWGDDVRAYTIWLALDGGPPVSIKGANREALDKVRGSNLPSLFNVARVPWV